MSLDRQLRAQLSLGTDALPYSAAIRQRAVRQHIAIADAIESGQGALAAKLTRRHFLELVEHPLRELQQRVRTRDSGSSDGDGNSSKPGSRTSRRS